MSSGEGQKSPQRGQKSGGGMSLPNGPRGNVLLFWNQSWNCAGACLAQKISRIVEVNAEVIKLNVLKPHYAYSS